MRRATAWVVVVGVVLGTCGSARAATADGFWVSIASGVAGASAPSGYQELWFETPHGPAPVAVTQLNGTNVEATTGGGTSFFNSGAVPVVLNPTDGYAYLANGPKPSDLSQSLTRQLAGGKGLASAAPDATATMPPANANLMSINLGEAAQNGSRPLSVGLTDPQGHSIGNLNVDVPGDGWWVIGLGPNPNEVPDPDPGSGPGSDPGIPTEPGPGSGGNPGPVATPEPASIFLAGIGGLGAFGWRLTKRRRVILDA